MVSLGTLLDLAASSALAKLLLTLGSAEPPSDK
jgi:hypothetical protein